MNTVDLAKLFEQVDWSEVATRLLHHAEHRLSRYRHLQDRLSATASDYVQEAIERVLEGRRKFAGRTQSDLFEFLCSVIDSLVDHDLEIAMWRRSPRSVWLEERDDEANVDLAGDDFEQEILARDAAQEFLALLPPDLRAYVYLRLDDDGATSLEYAMRLHVPVQTIRNLDRRLHRRRTMF